MAFPFLFQIPHADVQNREKFIAPYEGNTTFTNERNENGWLDCGYGCLEAAYAW